MRCIHREMEKKVIYANQYKTIFFSNNWNYKNYNVSIQTNSNNIYIYIYLKNSQLKYNRGRRLFYRKRIKTNKI